ncbi:sugar ABC transporter ATP-binding protein [Nonomuraea sp. NPDC000554]|uniref:sugar ABC transporter ATP-binding protein n=1 Tax=Nonomuraea sp. NPDC000554 TaxID=3154259 RepID=UPI00331DD619
MNDLQAPALDIEGLSKSYGPVHALRAVDFTLRTGEVRALLGKNGAGKSTLVKIISGAEHADAGTIRLNGEVVAWHGPADAQARGVGIVHQELSLVPGLTVAENISLGRWPRRGRFGGFVDSSTVNEIAERALEQLGERLPLWRPVGTLSLAEQQLVEIAKALAWEPRILILDEPTSALNAHEADALLALVRRLAGTGVSIIYVSHRMQEIPRVADTMTILRDGAEVATLGVGEASPAQVADMIAGESAERVVTGAESVPEDAPTVLEAEGLTKEHLLAGVSFSLREGEVLGLAGLLGSGRTEILEAIFGARDDVRGVVRVRGAEVSRRTPGRMLSLGVGLASEDRKTAGIVPIRSVAENLMLSARGRVLPGWWIRPGAERALVNRQIKDLTIATASAETLIEFLSGGNQQKVVIGRLLAAGLKVLLLDEPTRGVDIHAKLQIYTLIRALAREGVSTVFVSSELEELSEVCDRVLVLREGTVVGTLRGRQATPERLLSLVMGGDTTDAA